MVKRAETLKRANKAVAKTWRGYQRVANWVYEREWRKQRKLAFEPVTMKVGLGRMEGPLRCNCAGFPCQHVK